MQQTIKELGAVRLDLQEGFHDVQRSLETQINEKQPHFDKSANIPGTNDNFAAIEAKLNLFLEMISEIEKFQDTLILPNNVLSDIFDNAYELRVALSNLDGKLQETSKTYAGWITIDYTNFTATTATGHQVNFLSEFQILSNRCDLLLSNLLYISPLIRPKSGYRFAIAARELSRIIEHSNSTLVDAKQFLNETRSSAAVLGDLVNKAKENYASIEQKAKESDGDRNTIAGFLAKATEQTAAIEQTVSKSNNLETSIEASDEALQLFQKQIEERDRRFKAGESALDSLLLSIDEKQTKIDDLIAKSDQMLSLATVAGLASNFGQMKKELTNELKWSGYGFYGAIAFLAISAIPLFFLIMMPIAKPFLEYYFEGLQIVEQAALGNSWQYLGQVLGRLLILVPAIWLVKFTSIRYSSLFRLREHYAYKYSMAVAVEGFKKQAPHYGQEITAMVLEQLAFNPVDKLVPSSQVKEGKPPVFLSVLLAKFRQHLDKLDKDLDK